MSLCGSKTDTSGMNAAALANSQVAKDALDWYKQAYTDQAPLRQQAADKALAVSDAQLASMKQNDAISNDYWNYQKDTFRPLEGKIIADAQSFDSPERQNQNAAKATADVQQAFDSSQGQMQRSLARRGVNPSAGAALALNNQMSMQKATASAGASNKARTDTELQGYARKMDAANLGRNLASNQATSAGVAMTAGNSAVNNAGIPLTQAQSATNMAGQGFNTAIQGNNSAGSIYGQVAQLENQDSGLWGALGGVAGQFAGSAAGSAKMASFLSDKNAKKDIKPVSGTAALKAVKATPVSSWRYQDGQGDGGAHVGPMAQNVRKTMGETAAPGGKQIDLISMNGISMAAIAALDKKVGRLSQQITQAKAGKGIAA